MRPAACWRRSFCTAAPRSRPVTVGEKAGPYGPSAVAVDPVCGAPVLELTTSQIAGIVDDYASAARRARKAGFDAVQIHAAHGYLINQFLSPARNRRADAYGGELPGRARLLYEVYEAVRGAVGADYPVFVKVSAYDGFPGGVEPAEAVRVATELDARGTDAIEVSAGTPEGARRGGWDHIMPAPFAEGRFLDYALLIKAAVACPVVCVEGWRDPGTIAQALRSIDAVSLCRPFIREPHPRPVGAAETGRRRPVSRATSASSSSSTGAWAASFTESQGRKRTAIRAAQALESGKCSASPTGPEKSQCRLPSRRVSRQDWRGGHQIHRNDRPQSWIAGQSPCSPRSSGRYCLPSSCSCSTPCIPAELEKAAKEEAA